MPIYRANFLAKKYRPTRGPNSVKFGAAGDGAAATVVTELLNWTVGQNSSLQKNILFGNALPYPTGTRITGNILVADASFGVHRTRLRNVNTATTSAQMIALMSGSALAGAPNGSIVALSAAPSIPGGNAIASVNTVDLVNKF